MPSSQPAPTTTSTGTAKVALAWAFVVIPLAWGVFMTIRSALALFA